MEKHITAVATLHIGYSIFGVIVGLIILVLLATVGAIANDEEARIILLIIGTLVGGGFIALSIPGIIGGIGLLKHKNWARILILILSALDLICIPIGTALAVYTVWVLLQEETVRLFTPQAETAAPRPVLP